MKKRRYYNPYPAPYVSRRQRLDDSIERELARTRPHPTPAANDTPPEQEKATEGEKQNG